MAGDRLTGWAGPGSQQGATEEVTTATPDHRRRAVVASAQPLDATGQDRTLVVERVGHRSIDPGKRCVPVTIRDVGVAATAIR